jgi:hypothetical protein
MIYAVTRQDGQLEIIRCLPKSITITGRRMRVLGVAQMQGKWRWRLDTDDVPQLEVPFSIIPETGDCNPGSIPGATIEFYTPEEITKQRPELTGAEWVETSTGALPKYRDFRAAWKCNGGKVTEDIVACREIHMGRIRAERNKQLDALDKSYTRATGQKKQAEADAIEAKRQALRDLPQTFDLSEYKTTDELRAAWPVALRQGA